MTLWPRHGRTSDHLDVVHGGEKIFPLRYGIRALSLNRVLEGLEPLREPFG